MNRDMITYYRERAKEYEKLYYKPERQWALKEASDTLQGIFKDMKLLEIACGTGYWTERIATAARCIMATDINEAVLGIARIKNYGPATVQFECRDMYHPDGHYEGLFGGFIWSHISLQELPHFIGTLNTRVKPGGTIVFMDNIYVSGSSLPITRTDDHGNTYQTRKLENGSEYEVLKNFPAEDFLKHAVEPWVEKVEYIKLEYYWIIRYRTKAS
jgi:SAM-dependent methyltransferase